MFHMSYTKSENRAVSGMLPEILMKCFLLFTSLTIAIPALALSGKYPIKNFSPTDYGAGIQNIDFAQNRDLTLYVANNLGVLSFNGNQWTTYARNTGKKQRSLAFDESSNRLYVGSQGDFGYFEDNWKYVSLLDMLSPDLQDFDEVWDVFLFDNKVFFCTFQGIYQYDGQRISLIRHPAGLNRTFLADNKLFTQSQAGELFKIEGGKLIPLVSKGS